MRLTCPYCGPRGSEEFTYYGDARVQRPDGADDSDGKWYSYVYLRENPNGCLRELWWHASGCRSWLVVTRNVTTHAITEVRLARDRGAAHVALSPAALSPAAQSLAVKSPAVKS
ncbi:MAG: sarcosine oxidase subunit delta [Hyphomicrobiaceae bacterium]|nr:sarcosine oxidase subunit delta [Hyphomicrobiaceae bacterium]